MRCKERVDDAALGLIQLCCQWHADTIKPEVVHCQVHLATHFLISATTVLAAVIQMIARKLNRLAYLEDVFRICSLKHQHWVDLGNSQNKFCVFKVLFCFFVLVTHGIGIIGWQTSIEQKLSSILSNITSILLWISLG